MLPEVDMSFMESVLGDAGFEDEQPQYTVATPSNGHRPASFDAVAFLNAHGQRIRNTKSDGSGTTYVLEECPFDPNHKAPDSAVFVMANGAIGFRCLHSSCASYKWQDVRSKFDPTAYTTKTTHQTTAAQSIERPTEDELPEAIDIDELLEANLDLMPPTLSGLSRQSEVVNFIASTKVGKSWFTYLLAMSFATGKILFEKFRPTVGNVLIIDNELHRKTLAHRLRTVANALGLERREYKGRIKVQSLRGKNADLARISRYLLTHYKPGDLTVVIIDALYRCYPPKFDENSNADMTRLYNLLDSVAEKLNCTIVIVHHSSKGNQSLKQVTDVGSGAGAISRAADTHIVIRPHAEPGVAVVEVAVRSWAPVEPFCIKWTFPIWSLADEFDPKALKPLKPATGPGQAPDKPSALRQVMDRVLDAITASGAMTKNAMAAQISASGKAVKDATEALLEDGKIVTCEVTKNGKPYEAFDLPKPVTPTTPTDPDSRDESGCTPDPDKRTPLGDAVSRGRDES